MGRVAGEDQRVERLANGCKAGERWCRGSLDTSYLPTSVEAKLGQQPRCTE